MSNYTANRKGTLQHAKSFWQLLDMATNNSYVNNKQNTVHDTSDIEYYKFELSIPYWPQDLCFGGEEWYWVGGNGIKGQFRFRNDTLNYIKPGFYKFVGSEGGFYNKLIGQPEPCQSSHQFLVFEDDGGNRVRVRPGTVVIGEKFAKSVALQEGFKLPKYAKIFWPDAAKKCGVEDGVSEKQAEDYSLKREVVDLIIATITWLLFCWIGSWNPLFVIPFTVCFIGFIYFTVSRIIYREITLKTGGTINMAKGGSKL